MKIPSVTSMAPGLFGFLVMAAIGWNLPHARPAAAIAEENSTRDSSRDRGRPTKSQRDGDVIAAQIRSIRNAGSSKERLRSAAALANSIPPSEFAAWVEGDRFDFREGPELSVFRMIIFERWIKEAPETLIPWAGKNNYGQAGRALLTLASNSPQTLLDHYRNNPGDKAELQVLKEVAKKHPELALQRLLELSAAGLPSGSTHMASGLLEELAAQSSAGLEAVIATLSPELRGEAEKILGRKRLEASFSTELLALCERPDGWKIFAGIVSDKDELATRLIDDIASLPQSWKDALLQQTYDFVDRTNGKKWFDADLEGAGFSASQAKRIRMEALAELAPVDPEFAIKNLEGVDPRMKATLLSLALRSAKGDSAEAERLISMLGTEEDKQLARDQLKLAELATTPDGPPKPGEWLEKIGNTGGIQNNPYQVLHQLGRWDKAALGELRALFNKLPDDQKQNIARVVAAGGMHSTIDPGFAGDAICSLVNNPPAFTPGSRDDPAMASSVHAVQLSMNDPVAAASWINTLPEGEAKLWAFKNMAANWKQYDPKAVNEWVKTLPPAARDEVAQHLKRQQ